MTTVDDLMKIDGVIAAGESAADGRLVNYKSKMQMPQEMAQMTAQFTASVTMMFNTLAGAFTQLSKMQWVPQKVWMYTGGDYTVAVNGKHVGVFAETSKVDLNELYKALSE